jgi:hypothetical protein
VDVDPSVDPMEVRACGCRVILTVVFINNG